MKSWALVLAGMFLSFVLLDSTIQLKHMQSTDATDLLTVLGFGVLIVWAIGFLFSCCLFFYGLCGLLLSTDRLDDDDTSIESGDSVSSQ